MAARLESLARPGHILVSAPVHERTRLLFHFQAMGTTLVKGVSHPVAIYEATGERSELLPAPLVEVSDVFVGRDTELEQLRGLLAAFLDDQQGRLVVIQGEASVGKSQLISKALSVSVLDQAVVWRGRGLPYAQGAAYGVFHSLLQDALRPQTGLVARPPAPPCRG